jgi:putative FmdB family regulatory protein
MPTYQYRCTECGSELEAVQKFSDEPLRTCPECSGRLRKVFNAVGVVFKGSGFYATDSRTKKHSTGKPKADAAASTKTEVKAAAASSTETTSAA